VATRRSLRPASFGTLVLWEADIWFVMGALAWQVGEKLPPDTRRFHHSELDELRRVTASDPTVSELNRCVFRVDIDTLGAPDTIELLQASRQRCDARREQLAREALVQWRFAPVWVADRYVRARTTIQMLVTRDPSEVWELPIDDQVCW
jgi:hypothetical protein